MIVIPIHIAISEVLSFYDLLTGMPKTFLAIQRALFWNLINLPKTLRKRSRVQESRKLSDEEIFSIVAMNASPLYYLHSLSLLRK